MTEKEVLHYMGLDSSEALSPQPAAVHCAAFQSGVLHAIERTVRIPEDISLRVLPVGKGRADA